MLFTSDCLYDSRQFLFSNFKIGPGSDKYRLTVSGYSGNAERNSLYWHNNRQFTTKDADHDSAVYNCAYALEGGWWYETCADSNLNGNFKKSDVKGIWWRADGGSPDDLRYTEMKFRRRFRKEMWEIDWKGHYSGTVLLTYFCWRRPNALELHKLGDVSPFESLYWIQLLIFEI